MFSLQQLKISFTDYLKYNLVGTPLQKLAEEWKKFIDTKRKKKHPELEEIYLEASRIEELMHRVIERSSNCIDIGCHIGSVLSKIVKIAPDGHHLAFEPTPYKAKRLKRKFPSVDIYEIALSDRPGETVFYQNPTQSGYNGLRPHKSDDKSNRLNVQTELLDNLVDFQKPIDFIKIDVEGAELLSLRGATKILDRLRPIVLFECSKSGLSCFDLQPTEIFDFLTHEHDYSIFLLKCFLNNGEPLTLESFEKAMEYPFQAFNFVAAPTIR